MSATDWRPIDSAPKDGSTIRVRHDRGTYCGPVVVGCWDWGNWHCSEVFIDPDTRRIYYAPTHWKAAPPTGPATPGTEPNTDTTTNQSEDPV